MQGGSQTFTIAPKTGYAISDVKVDGVSKGKITSCTFSDVMIDRDLDQISAMMKALKGRITDERINRIYSMSGEEKEEAFQKLAGDLHDVCMGKTDEEEEMSLAEAGKEEDDNEGMSAGKIVFGDFTDLARFCASLKKEWFLPSSVYPVLETGLNPYEGLTLDEYAGMLYSLSLS